MRGERSISAGEWTDYLLAYQLIVFVLYRRAVETVEVENDNRKLQGLEPKLVMISDVQAVIKAMSSSGPCLWIQQASLHQKILLLALSRCVKKQGQDQIKFGDVSLHTRATGSI